MHTTIREHLESVAIGPASRHGRLTLAGRTAC